MGKENTEAIKTDVKAPGKGTATDGMAITKEDIDKMIQEAVDEVIANKTITGAIEKANADSDVRREELIRDQCFAIGGYVGGIVVQFISMTIILVDGYRSFIAPVVSTSRLFSEGTAAVIWFGVVLLAAVSLVFNFLRRKSKKKWQEIQDKLDSESDGNNKNDSRRMIRARRDTLLRKYFITAFELILNTILYAIFMVGIGFGGWCFCYPSFPSNKPMLVAGIVISIVFMLVASIIFSLVKKGSSKTLREIENKYDSDLLG